MNNRYVITIAVFWISAVASLVAGCAGNTAGYAVPVSGDKFLYPDYKVAVLDLRMNTAGYSNDSPLYEKSVEYNAGKRIANEIETILVRWKLFPVVERTDIDRVLMEHNLRGTGITENDSEIINLLNANAVWVGQVNEFCTYEQIISIIGRCNFSVKLIDTKTGSILYTFSADESAIGSPENAMKKAMVKFSRQVSDIKIPE